MKKEKKSQVQSFIYICLKKVNAKDRERERKIREGLS